MAYRLSRKKCGFLVHSHGNLITEMSDAAAQGFSMVDGCATLQRSHQFATSCPDRTVWHHAALTAACTTARSRGSACAVTTGFVLEECPRVRCCHCAVNAVPSSWPSCAPRRQRRLALCRRCGRTLRGMHRPAPRCARRCFHALLAWRIEARLLLVRCHPGTALLRHRLR
jgi:hypothetical protein